MTVLIIGPAPPPSPQMVTGLTALSVSISQINLTWNASSDPGGPGLKDYGVYRQGVGLLGYVTGTSYSDTGLTASTQYTYWITARDTSLVESPNSAAATATTQNASASGFIPNAALGVTFSGTYADGQMMTVNLPGGGLGARANAKPRYLFMFGEDGSTTLSTHALSRISKTYTADVSNPTIQSAVAPPNALGAMRWYPIGAAGTSAGATPFTDAPHIPLVGGAGSWTYIFQKRCLNFTGAPGNMKFFRHWPSAGFTKPDFYMAYNSVPNEYVMPVEDHNNASVIGPQGEYTPLPRVFSGTTFETWESWYRENTINVVNGMWNVARNAVLGQPLGENYSPCFANNATGSNLTGGGPHVSLYFDEYTKQNNLIPNSSGGTADAAFMAITYVDDSPLLLFASNEGAVYQTKSVFDASHPEFKREIQIQTLRSDTSITFQVRKGEYASLTGVHLLATTGFGTAIDLGVGA